MIPAKRRVRPATVWVPATVAVALATALTVAVNFPRVALVDEAALQVIPREAPLSLGTPIVKYSITGSGSVQVSYITARGDLSTARVQAPWSVEVTFPSPMRPASLTATALDSDTGDLSCRIVVDGRSRADQQGDEGSVACSVVAI